jgi:hypothetical protein
MKKKKLISMEENNHVAFENANYDYNKPQLNGIACPKCGAELYDSEPMITMTSNPPQKSVHCSECKYKGNRFC